VRNYEYETRFWRLEIVLQPVQQYSRSRHRVECVPLDICRHRMCVAWCQPRLIFCLLFIPTCHIGARQGRSYREVWGFRNSPAVKIKEIWGVYPKIHPTRPPRGSSTSSAVFFCKNIDASFTALHLQDSFCQQLLYLYNLKVGWPASGPPGIADLLTF